MDIIHSKKEKKDTNDCHPKQNQIHQMAKNLFSCVTRKIFAVFYTCLVKNLFKLHL